LTIYYISECIIIIRIHRECWTGWRQKRC